MSKNPPERPPARTVVGLDDVEIVKVHSILDKIERTFLPLGSQIGKYRIIEEIDRGGMAVVYKATQLDLDRIVALKVLPANVTINRKFVERFLSEAHAVAKLNHPNIVSIHEVSMENNIYFLAMDYIPGLNLYHYLPRKKPKLVEVLEIFVQLADALGYAHEQKILHRDLKLNNVIMRENKTPVLIDFGLAKAMEGDDDVVTKTGEIMGSPAYMAPERILGGQSDARADVCSLGIMLYEILTFKNPYLDPRSIHQTTLNVIEADPIPPRKLVPWLPAEVEAITLKAMNRDPDRRYQSMREFQKDLMRYQHGEQVSANLPSVWSRLRHTVRKRWAAFAIAATVLVCGAVLAAMLYHQSQKEQWRWKVVSEERFSNANAIAGWEVGGGKADTARAQWRVSGGALQVKSSGFSYIKLDRLFTRDLRFEFDIRATSASLHDAGFFVCGDTPEQGYRFFVHRGAEALHGITYPGSSFLFYDCDPMHMPGARSYHAVVEKIGDAISFRLDDVLIAKIYDCALPLGERHQSVGFFVNGGALAIDNLVISRLAMPALASPSVIANRFWEHGDFRAALNEYRDLLIDEPHAAIVDNVKLRMIDCMIRLGELEAADHTLALAALDKNDNEALAAPALYLRACIEEARGDTVAADRAYVALADRFPANPVNQSIVAHRLMRLVESRHDNDTSSACEDRIALLCKTYPRYSFVCGRAHLSILDRYAAKGMVERVRLLSQRIVELYDKDPDIQAEAHVTLARTLLGKRDKRDAVEILDQTIASQVQSPGVLRAWMMLAEVYESERNFADALTIYRKLYEECPPTQPLHWQARVKMGELGRLAPINESPSEIIAHVILAPHPFAMPRLVARFYADSISAPKFESEWRLVSDRPEEAWYYEGRKAFMAGELGQAENSFARLLRKLAPDSWEYVKVYQLRELTLKR